MKDIVRMSVAEQSAALLAKELSSYELTVQYLDRIDSIDGRLGAFITVSADRALMTAKEADERIRVGCRRGVLDGIPYALKDNICTKGLLTTCASKMLGDFVPMYDATVVKKLKQSGAVLLGKTNMDEFAMGSGNENSAFGITRNPCDLSRVAGGSSGGSAAAVAANEAAFALGSDTGGSVRLPSSFCGVVGLKPTYGTVSRYGLVAFASGLDVIGPICKSVYDSALVYEAIKGRDDRDASSIEHTASCADGIDRGIEGMRIALPRELCGTGADSSVNDAVDEAARTLCGLGAQVCEVSMPSLEYALAVYYIICTAEASSNLARYDGVRYGYRTQRHTESIEEFFAYNRSEAFGEEVKRRILLGTFVLSEGYAQRYYKKAQRLRERIRCDFDTLFSEYDLVLSAVSPTTAYGIGEKSSSPLDSYKNDIYTVCANLAGVPAITLPCGVDGDGMPIGMQLMSGRGREDILYRAAYAFEKEREEKSCLEVRHDL